MTRSLEIKKASDSMSLIPSVIKINYISSYYKLEFLWGQAVFCIKSEKGDVQRIQDWKYPVQLECIMIYVEWLVTILFMIVIGSLDLYFSCW